MPMPDFQRFETVIYFAKNTFAGKITLDNVNKDQANLVTELITSNNRPKQRTREYLQKKILMKAWKHFLLEQEQWFLMLLKVEYFLYHQLKVQESKY